MVLLCGLLTVYPLLYSSSVDDTISNYYLNSPYFSVDIDGSKNMELAADFNENLSEDQPRKIFNFSKQIENWKYSKSEVISWESKDGCNGM